MAKVKNLDSYIHLSSHFIDESRKIREVSFFPEKIDQKSLQKIYDSIDRGEIRRY